jgi:hypothetical protein
MIQVLKCGERTEVLDMLSWCWVATDIETLLSVYQSIQLARKALIGRGEPIFWPPGSSDRTPRTFLWEYVKNIVHDENICQATNGAHIETY